MKNNLPFINNITTRFIKTNTLSDICNSIRSIRNSSETFKIGSIPEIIDSTDFGIKFPGGYGGAAFDLGNNLYRKFASNQTFMVPIIGRDVINCQEAFNNCLNLFGPPLMKSDICDSMYSTFRGAFNLSGEIEIGKNVKNLGFTFYNCSNLYGKIPDGLNVTDMNSAFYNCSSVNGVLGSFPNATNLYQTFYNCANMIGSPFQANNVTTMYQAYYNCSNITGVPVTGPKVTTMEGAYYNCTNIVGTAVCSETVTTIADAYYNCTSLDGVPTLGSATTNAHNAFYNCTNLRGTPNFKTKKLVSLYQTFYNCVNMSGTVDVPGTVTNLIGSFYNCTNLSVIIIRGTNATTLAAAKQANCFAGDANRRKLSVVYTTRAVYNVGRTAAVAGCDLTADEVLPEPIVVPQPYTYSNGKIYGYNNELKVTRRSYNEEMNVYVYCTV